MRALRRAFSRRSAANGLSPGWGLPLRALRPRRSEAAGGSGGPRPRCDPAAFHVALPRAHAQRPARQPGRRAHAAAAGPAARPRVRRRKPLVEGRRPESHRQLQGAGLSCAVTMLRQFGVRAVAIPTAGNAGSALAAYAAAAGLEAHIYAPADVPKSNLAEYRYYGAHVTLVNGLISDCGRQVQQAVKEKGWFDVSTMKEPYRVEGKKTMGLEVVEQLGWRVPDVIFYPTGGGVGLIGMWKAFEEMEQLGWIGTERPRMVAVQAAGCAPVVRAFAAGASRATAWENAATVAAGLRVPKPYADDLILEILRKSNGTAVAVSEDEVRQAVRDLARTEGVFAAPEAAAAVAGARQLYAGGWLRPKETVVLYLTGGGLKYLEELGLPA